MSTAIAIPSGPIIDGPEWCVQKIYDIGSISPPYTYNECYNSTRGTSKASFQTICCDGTIIDTLTNIWSVKTDYKAYALDLANLVCCREGGRLQPGGLLPIDSDYTHCSASQAPTPLASLAATNTDNAALYAVTYESASGYGTKLADWTTTGTPMCLWVETASGKVPLTTVEVPQAQITTLPPPTTDAFGMPIASESGSAGESFTLTGLPTISKPRGSAVASSSTSDTGSASSSAPAATASSSAGRRLEGRLVGALFGVAAGLSVLAML